MEPWIRPTFLIWGLLALLALIIGAVPLARMLRSRRRRDREPPG